MSGHSKWSKIKRQKEVVDAKKSKEFSRAAQLIKAALRGAAGDRNSPSVRAAIEKARAVNMPRENIERALTGAGEDTDKTECITYEAYGPSGVAIIVETETRNRNKAAAEIKHVLDKHGLSLASPGAALWAFEKKNFAWIPKQTIAISENDQGKLDDLKESLEELDGVQTVYTNASV